MPRIVFTTGEPAGIGPDLAILLAQRNSTNAEIIAIADEALLSNRANQLGLPFKARLFKSEDYSPSTAGELRVLPVPLNSSCTAGVLDPANAGYVLKTLEIAVDGCLTGEFDAMVTGPLHKGVINDAGYKFTGHTEFLAKRSNAYPVMMLVTDALRVALATTHLPLSSVSSAITDSLLTSVIQVLHHDLRHVFSIKQPKILVCGLNPHAGENGHLGCEEIEIIQPCLESMRKQGIDVVGPLPADTLFTPHHLNSADAVLAMYHDQGLPVLKYAGFGEAVNITLGLPIIRTSVDHGTALDLAGTGNINDGSLNAALKLAIKLAVSRNS